MDDREEIRKFKIFESLYLEIRAKEGRLLTITEIEKLPFANKNNPHYGEWAMRISSTKRLLEYIKNRNLDFILDLGCGNGWLLHQIAPITQKITGLEVNRTELEQAKEVVRPHSNVQLVYGDIYKWEPLEKFNMIILNAVIQYFDDLKMLLDRLLTMVRPGGEIHILDSPIYSDDRARDRAKQRTFLYYKEIKIEEMAGYYFHHIWSAFEDYDTRLLYNPKSFQNRIQRNLGQTDSPFPWIRIQIHRDGISPINN